MNKKLLGWRKFLFTALVVATSVGLLICDKLKGDQWVSLMQIIVPAFLTSNLVEYFSKRGPGNDTNGTPT